MPPSEEAVRGMSDEAVLDLLCQNHNHWDWATTHAETRNAEEIVRICRAEALRRMAAR